MRYLTTFVIFLCCSGQAGAIERIDVGLFSQQNIEGWKQKSFVGETSYRLDKIDDQSVIVAHSRQSASAFYKKMEVDLQKTPILNWSWYKRAAIDPGNEGEKSGDDYAARIYVIKDGGLFFWKTLAINYVWSAQHAKGESWENPFAGKNAMMLAQRDASNPVGEWYFEQRNIVADFEALFGKKITSIDGVAIMTDSDNSELSAQAYYGDIYFTAE